MVNVQSDDSCHRYPYNDSYLVDLFSLEHCLAKQVLVDSLSARVDRVNKYSRQAATKTLKLSQL